MYSLQSSVRYNRTVQIVEKLFWLGFFSSTRLDVRCIYIFFFLVSRLMRWMAIAQKRQTSPNMTSTPFHCGVDVWKQRENRRAWTHTNTHGWGHNALSVCTYVHQVYHYGLEHCNSWCGNTFFGSWSLVIRKQKLKSVSRFRLACVNARSFAFTIFNTLSWDGPSSWHQFIVLFRLTAACHSEQ